MESNNILAINFPNIISIGAIGAVWIVGIWIVCKVVQGSRGRSGGAASNVVSAY